MALVCDWQKGPFEILYLHQRASIVTLRKEKRKKIYIYICIQMYWTSLDVKSPIFTLDATRASTQFPVTRNSQITVNLPKSSFSRAILDI